jgi:lantibiotic biosynthesis protein
MTIETAVAGSEAERIAALLNDPATTLLRDDVAGQSLGAGKLGVMLLHYERARTGHGDRDTARNWLRATAYPRVNSAADTNLYNGAPGLAFALHTSAADGGALELRRRLHERVKGIVSERLVVARERIRQGRAASFAEYSQLSGLCGLGFYLLATEPRTDLTGELLTYLVALTKPIRIDGVSRPGWWTTHDPYLNVSEEFPGGHANLGAAHGIPGPLACLAIAHRGGVTVPGQIDAIERISRFYDTWQHEHGWWPQWLTGPELDQGRSEQLAPGRPSWCYGAPGIARALQLAAIALADPVRQRTAEDALLRCLADEVRQANFVEGGLCHGVAGLYRIVQRAAEDAQDARLAAALPGLERRLLASEPTGNGFLDGAAGIALALQSRGPAIADGSTWDTALALVAPGALR